MGIRIGLIGFGTVGQAVARRLTDGRDSRLRLVRVCARAGGRIRPDWLARSVGWSNGRTDRPVISWLPRPPIASTALSERTK
jgi:hypothetical protein